MSQRCLAKKYNCGKTQIQQILKNKTSSREVASKQKQKY
jgi:Mor family transcriptional regulator